MAYPTALLDPTLVFVWVSPSITDATGWQPDELVGTSALDYVVPDDLAELRRLLDPARAVPNAPGQDPARRSTNRVRFRTRGGGWVALEFAANSQLTNPEVRGIVVVFVETTERRLIDGVYEAMASGESLGDIATKVAALLSWQAYGARASVSLPGVTPPVEVSVGRRDADTVVVSHQIDEVGRLEVEYPDTVVVSDWFRLLLDRSAGLVRVAVSRHLGEQLLVRRLAEKTAIIAAVSHDLRSPIAAIQLMSNLLDGDEERLSEDQRRRLATRIRTDAQRTSRLLADLTAVDRILHGATELHVQPVSLGALTERVLNELDVDGRAAPTVATGDVMAVVDPALTERIVDNLLSNAMKHTPSDVRIHVSFEALEDVVVVHVDDDGSGVPMHERERIFDAYVRGDAEQRHRPGSGMGLFLVRTFAEVQGGAADCSASPWGGARFSVRLPAAPTQVRDMRESPVVH